MSIWNVRTLGTLGLAMALNTTLGCGASTSSGARDFDDDPDPEPGTEGTVDIRYTFSGTEAPNRVKVFVLDGNVGGQNCGNLPFVPTQGIVATRSGLPISGSVSFDNVEEGTRYVVVAYGEKSNGVRVAEACQDGINVIAEETTLVELTLENWVADTNGNYLVEQNLNMGLPSNITNVLLGLQAVCGLLQNASELCNVVSEVNDIVTSLDVVSQWTITEQVDGTFLGEVQWLTVEGQDVGAYELVSGGFTGEVPGSTTMNYKNYQLDVEMGNLVLFILEEVLDLDLGNYGTYGAIVVNALADNYLSPLTFSGTGAMSDTNADGMTDKITGNLAGHLQVGSFNHDFAMDYVALRQ